MPKKVAHLTSHHLDLSEMFVVFFWKMLETQQVQHPHTSACQKPMGIFMILSKAPRHRRIISPFQPKALYGFTACRAPLVPPFPGWSCLFAPGKTHRGEDICPVFFSKGPPKQPTHPGHLGYDSDLLEPFNLIHPSLLLMLQKSGAFCGSLGVGSFICLMHFNPMIYPRF